MDALDRFVFSWRDYARALPFASEHGRAWERMTQDARLRDMLARWQEAGLQVGTREVILALLLVREGMLRELRAP